MILDEREARLSNIAPAGLFALSKKEISFSLIPYLRAAYFHDA